MDTLSIIDEIRELVTVKIIQKLRDEDEKDFYEAFHRISKEVAEKYGLNPDNKGSKDIELHRAVTKLQAELYILFKNQH